MKSLNIFFFNFKENVELCQNNCSLLSKAKYLKKWFFNKKSLKEELVLKKSQKYGVNTFVVVDKEHIQYRDDEVIVKEIEQDKGKLLEGEKLTGGIGFGVGFNVLTVGTNSEKYTVKNMIPTSNFYIKHKRNRSLIVVQGKYEDLFLQYGNDYDFIEPEIKG